MAQTIKLKRSATAGAAPTTSQLELGEVAINTYDGKMYIKKSVGGTESIVEISGGGASAADAIFEEYLYTATSNQTAFTGNDDNSAFLSYVSGAIQVFLNGVLLDPETDYTATNGATVTLTSGAATGDYLQIIAFKKKIGDSSITIDTFSGNNSTTAFTLSLDPGDENNTRVFIDGVYQSKSNYTVSGTTLTFSSAPPSGTGIEVEIGNRAVSLDTTSSLDLPDNVKLRLGTSQDLEIYHDASDSLINDNGTGSLKLQTGGSTKLEVTSTGVDVTGNVAVSGTVDGVDIAARDAVLTSTTTTAGAALPRTGGAMTGAITTNSTFDGRDVATDGAKLDGIEAGATADQTQSEINALGITATGLSGTPAISVANITTTGELRGPASLVIDPAAVGDNTGTVVIKGNLQVDGATTTINSTTLTVDDLNLTLASGAANGTAANGAGITVDGASATITYNSTGDSWDFNKDINVGNMSISGQEIDVSSGSLTLDVASSIILDSDAGNIYLRDHDTDVGLLSMANTDVYIRSLVSNRDIIFQGYDSGSNITALTLDMSNNGKALFNHGAEFESNVVVHGNAGASLDWGDTSTLGQLTFDGSGNPVIRSSVSNKSLVIQGVDAGASINALTLDMSNAGAATFNAGSTFSGNLSITAGSGQRHIEIASGTTNAKTYRIYNGISWNPDALLIYNHTDDATVLTIEPGKLGVNRGANSLSQTLEVGGGALITGNLQVDGTITTDGLATDGTITINGSGSEDRYLKFALDGRGSAFTGENAAFIFCGQGGSGDFLAGGLYLQSRSATAGREIGFITGTTPAKRMVIDSNGNVGIGTGSAALSARFHAYTTGYPVAKFERYGSSAATRGWTQIGHSSLSYSGATGADTYIVTQHGFGVAVNEGTNALTITDGGLVGIGTSNPDEKLVVSGDGARIYVNSADYHIAMIGRRGSSGTALDQGYLRLKDQGTNKVVLDTAGDSYLTGGDVGIGTTSPAAKLDVEAGDLGGTTGNTTTAAIFRAGRQNLIFQDTRTATDTDWKNATFKMIAQIDSTNHQSIDFVNDGSYSEHIDIRTGNQVFNTRFKHDGKVGIGTQNPYKKLEVAGDIQLDATDANIWIKSGAAGTNGFINWTFNTDSTVYNKVGMDYDTRATTGFHIDTGYPITIDSSSSTGIKFVVNTTSIGKFTAAGLYVGTGNEVQILQSGSSLFPSIKLNNNGYLGSASTTTAIQIRTDGTLSLAPTTATSGQAILSTGAYASGQGDNRTHFGYNASGSYYNYIRGANTVISGPSQFDAASTFNYPATFAAGNRPVVINGGAITMQGETGGWAFGLHAIGSSNTNHGGFGFLGGDDSLSYYYIGEQYNASNNFRFYKNGTLQVGGTTILDSNKNITNIGTATLSSTTSTLLTLNPTANNYGGITFQYGGVTKGASMYNSGFMVFGGEAGTDTRLQSGGQYGLSIRASDRNVSIGSHSSYPEKLYVNGNIRADGHYYVGGLAVIDSSRNVANVASVTIDNNNNDYNFKAKAGSVNSWFGVYDDANDSANIIVIRSNNVESFKHLGHTGETVIKATGTGLRIESTDAEAIQISGTGGGLNFQTGSNQRIYFNSQRAMEGNSTGTNLQIGESYSLINLQANTVIHGNLTPNANNTYDLGSSSQVWRDLYIGDLNLNNETRVNDDGTTGNEIDGTTGNWTVQEGEEHLYLINNKNGKKYKFALEEIE